jgi:mannose-1-phosphate guanylyltransferase
MSKPDAGRLTPVILCGGVGSRLWPLSRSQMPKQFMALASERTLLQDTVLRVSRPDLYNAPLLFAARSIASLPRSSFARSASRPPH